MNLLESQERFWGALTGGAVGDDCFRETPGLPAEERLQIYAKMFLFRQVDALRADFPLVEKAVGEHEFFDLARDYVLAHPSEDPDLGKLGRVFAAFCRARDAALGDLAELEWARAQVFFAPECQPVLFEEFIPLLERDDFASARLFMNPALRVLTLQHDVVTAWDALQKDEKAAPPLQRACSVAVWRTGFEVFHAEVPAEEAEALRRAQKGAQLGEVLGAFSDPIPAYEALQTWLGEGYIAQP